MRMHILLIDDDIDELGILMDALSQIEGDFNCTYASSAEWATEILKQETPDLIFIDYNLPMINGLEFLSAFNGGHQHSRTRVFLYSTKINEEVKKTAYELGAAGCIEKTITIKRLVEELRAVLNTGSPT